MKKRIAILLIGIIVMGSLTACASEERLSSSVVGEDGKSISIVTTIFPEYDWVQAVLGDQADYVDVTMLLDNGTDLHSYQPTVVDIAKISNCDLFVYVGGESDQWAEDALSGTGNPDRKVMNLLEILGDAVKEEEVVEGMEAEDESGDHGDRGSSDDEEDEPEYDEHVWLSLRNAEIVVQEIADTMGEIDPEHTAVYSANADAYIHQLQALDSEYQQAVQNGEKDTLLFGDRFPFRYLVDDYGLNYYAAFTGCSAETEASFETVVFLANKMDELRLHTVLTIEGTDHRIAETIVENTQSKDSSILIMNSMQGTTSQDVEQGATYISIMEENLGILKEALK